MNSLGSNSVGICQIETKLSIHLLNDPYESHSIKNIHRKHQFIIRNNRLVRIWFQVSLICYIMLRLASVTQTHLKSLSTHFGCVFFLLLIASPTPFSAKCREKRAHWKWQIDKRNEITVLFVIAFKHLRMWFVLSMIRCHRRHLIISFFSSCTIFVTSHLHIQNSMLVSKVENWAKCSIPSQWLSLWWMCIEYTRCKSLRHIAISITRNNIFLLLLFTLNDTFFVVDAPLLLLSRTSKMSFAFISEFLLHVAATLISM